MKINAPNLFTPLYLKLSDDMPWPKDEKVFYLLTRNGPYLCRNHPFFRSSVPSRKLPGELVEHESFLELTCPKIPQRLFERIIGFFDIIAERHGAEAAVLLIWNTRSLQFEVVGPPQVSIVSASWKGSVYPVEVHYKVPSLPPHLLLVGDIHSHVDEPAFASHMDKNDETHRPGLHIVVGRLFREPPEFHLEMVVDGVRFSVKSLFSVVQGYQRRSCRDVPHSWIDQVTVTTWSNYYKHGDSSCESESDKERLDRWLMSRSNGQQDNSTSNGTDPRNRTI
jgi:PRTRC genetic system protein A